MASNSRHSSEMQAMTDLKHAARALRKSPVLAITAILSLALGIGANITVFSVVREMILDDLSARHPEQLLRLNGADVSYTIFRELRLISPLRDLA